jgi:hypothetical protein
MLQNVDPAETSFGMAVVFQETFVGAISSITMLATEPYLTSLLGLDLWLRIFPGCELKAIKPKHSLQ